MTTGRRNYRPASIPTLALFQKRIDGDEALLQLAGLRFQQGGIGAEFYAEKPDELERLMKFRPSSDLPATVHLSRGIDLFRESDQRLIQQFAAGFARRISGVIIHDQQEIIANYDEYLGILQKLNGKLMGIERGPCLFVEYATGLNPELFMKLHRSARSLAKVSACLDIGHLGIWAARRAFSQRYPDQDVCDLSPTDPGLSGLVQEVQTAVDTAPEEVLRVIQELGRLRKPIHFHLHDAHPLSKSSQFGVPDHLSFLGLIPLPFAFQGRRSIPHMFGPIGLSKVVEESLKAVGPERLSFALEIHPTAGRMPLGDASHLFAHWADKRNAERMNYWLSVVLQNHLLLLDTCARSLQRVKLRNSVGRPVKATRKRGENVP